MGRMFEALRQADAPLDPAAAERLAPLRESAAVAAGSTAPEDVAPEEHSDAPFIEVGPRKSVEASPGILERVPLVPPPPMPHVADEEPILAGTEEEKPEAAPQPMTISFRPSAATAAPPIAPSAPRPRLAAELIAYHCPEHPASVKYAELLTSLAGTAPTGRASAYLFTSAQMKAGTTTVLLNLAITAARQGRQRVIVVDGNLRHPGIAARLGIAAEPGLRDVLDGTSTLEEAIQETAQINLFALTSGACRAQGSPRLVAGTMRSLLRDLRRTFDLILVDGPRWDSRPDVVAAGLACDAVYVVMPEREAESPQTDQLIQIITAQAPDWEATFSHRELVEGIVRRFPMTATLSTTATPGTPIPPG